MFCGDLCPNCSLKEENFNEIKARFYEEFDKVKNND